MELVVFWVLCAVLGGVIASSRGASVGVGVALGGLLGPIGVLITFFIGGEDKVAEKRLDAGERKKCPRCAELVQPDAEVCRFCGHEFVAAG